MSFLVSPSQFGEDDEDELEAVQLLKQCEELEMRLVKEGNIANGEGLSTNVPRVRTSSDMLRESMRESIMRDSQQLADKLTQLSAWTQLATVTEKRADALEELMRVHEIANVATLDYWRSQMEKRSYTIRILTLRFVEQTLSSAEYLGMWQRMGSSEAPDGDIGQLRSRQLGSADEEAGSTPSMPLSDLKRSSKSSYAGELAFTSTISASTACSSDVSPSTLIVENEFKFLSSGETESSCSCSMSTPPCSPRQTILQTTPLKSALDEAVFPTSGVAALSVAPSSPTLLPHPCGDAGRSRRLARKILRNHAFLMRPSSNSVETPTKVRDFGGEISSLREQHEELCIKVEALREKNSILQQCVACTELICTGLRESLRYWREETSEASMQVNMSSIEQELECLQRDVEASSERHAAASCDSSLSWAYACPCRTGVVTDSTSLTKASRKLDQAQQSLDKTCHELGEQMRSISGMQSELCPNADLKGGKDSTLGTLCVHRNSDGERHIARFDVEAGIQNTAT
eukprot:TRINITY_DN68850_c0_g1_i1.p1 TRINITY_DN68850_c0_g1~~TRINITY_DN68850_c0_g1_i1.p1  ORF type:complete len:518 (-),score=93.69 TRINITY_DN68850_c0_g1_i1:57-1610(-)